MTRTGGPTLLRPDEAHRAEAAGPDSQGLPSDLVRQATRRLRVMALLYAAIFFLVDFFPTLISTADRSAQFGAIVQWLPGTIAISVALFVAAAVTNPRLSPRAAAAIAIVFEVAASYGIAAAELLQPRASTIFETPRGSGSRGSPSGRSSLLSPFPRRRGGRCSRRSPHPAACP